MTSKDARDAAFVPSKTEIPTKSDTPTRTAISAPTSTTQAWDILVERVEAFLAVWRDHNTPPPLADYLPTDPKLRRMVLGELIKADLEMRWEDQRAPKKIEEYVAEFPDLAIKGEVPGDLIYEEFHVRRQFGEDPSVEEYCERFPKQREQLKRLLNLEEPHLTTTMIGANSSKEVEVGQQIDDFDLLTQLGKGAFASVFLARQRSMQRLVALKVSADKGTEPQLLAQLDHPHIVRVYDQRQLPERKLRLLYMQHIPGGTLQPVVDRVKQTPAALRTGKILLEAIDQALDARGEAPPTESSARRRLAMASWPEAVCWLGARMAAALDYAHKQGVLHRDVKPANVLLAADGAPKLADFNVSCGSKVEGSAPAAYFGGSLAYMSPEQMEAANPDHTRQPEELDGQSDVYSLGVMLWEMVTGTRPFGDEAFSGSWTETLEQMTARRKNGVGPSAKALLPKNLPPGMEDVLLTCLEADTSKRYATAGQLARQLELCLQPRVQRLLAAPTMTWKHWLRRQPVVAYIGLGVLPQAIFSGFNIGFNVNEVIKKLTEPEQSFFNVEVLVVNSTCFPVGIALAVWLAWPVLRAVQQIINGKKRNMPNLTDLRRRSLRLSEYVTWITMALWVVSGPIFPAWLWLRFGSESTLTLQHGMHFMLSQFLSGLIASTQTYFLMTFVCVRGLYPLMVQADAHAERESEWLARLSARSVWYFGLAVSAPFVSLMLMTFFEQGRFYAGLLSLLGFVGSLLAFWLLRNIQSDLAALMVAVDPARDPLGSASETVESFWSSTR